jgi:hypothetical protein
MTSATTAMSPVMNQPLLKASFVSSDLRSTRKNDHAIPGGCPMRAITRLDVATKGSDVLQETDKGWAPPYAPVS